MRTGVSQSMHRTHTRNLICALMEGQQAEEECKLLARCCASGIERLRLPLISAWLVLQMYRAGQKRIAQKALAALSREACGLLQELQEQSQKLAAVDESRSAPANPPANGEGAAHAPGLSEKRALGSASPSKGNGLHSTSPAPQQGQHLDSSASALPLTGHDRTEGQGNGRVDPAQACIGTALEALQGEHARQTGVIMKRSCREGEVVARQHLSSGFIASSRDQLALDLAAARCTKASRAGKSQAL